MKQKIAIAIIHGAGEQKKQFADKMVEELKEKFVKEFPRNQRTGKAKGLVFMPVYWADILGKTEHELWGKVNSAGNLDFVKLRKFIMNFAADAIAYQPGKGREDVYFQIHTRMAEALKKLAETAGPEAPLCIIGHSLGTIITHNYLYDVKDTGADSRVLDNVAQGEVSKLEFGETLTLFYTMGSPLALWSLRYSLSEEYAPIQFPGGEVGTLFPKVTAKWLNFYDVDDILAYPISGLSKKHKELAANGLLEDRAVNIGSLLASWNPASHVQYWTDNDVTVEIAKSLARLWQQVN